MTTLDLHRLWTRFCSLDRASLLLLAGAVAFSIALVVLIRTRWGHSRSLEKCVLFSVLAHLLFTGYAATVQFVTYRSPPKEQFVRIALVDGPAGAEHGQLGGVDPAASPLPPKPPKPAAMPGAADRKEVKPKSSVVAEAKPEGADYARSQNRKRAPPMTAGGSAGRHSSSSRRRSPQLPGWQLAESAEKVSATISANRTAPKPTSRPRSPPIPVVALTPPATAEQLRARLQLTHRRRPQPHRPSPLRTWRSIAELERRDVPCRKRTSSASPPTTSAWPWQAAAARKPRPPCRPP